MKWCLILTILTLSPYLTTATFEREMAALEKDLEAEYRTAKDAAKKSNKSLVEMSTDELIAELEKEFKPKNDNAAKREDVDKKYRARLEAILQKKDEFEKLLNDDNSKTNEDKISSKDMVKLLSDAVSNVQKKDMVQCKDTRMDCHFLKKFCSTHFDKLVSACPKTCGYCSQCVEKASKEICQFLKGKGQCSRRLDPATVLRVRTMCPETCGYCRVEAPAVCSKSKHGCCWDRHTPKEDAAGTNCQSCDDKYRYACKTFKVDCKSLMRPGAFMRYFCPNTCNLCDGACYDSVDHFASCPFWDKTLKWCKDKEEMMRFYCPKTCKYC